MENLTATYLNARTRNYPIRRLDTPTLVYPEDRPKYNMRFDIHNYTQKPDERWRSWVTAKLCSVAMVQGPPQ